MPDSSLARDRFFSRHSGRGVLPALAERDCNLPLYVAKEFAAYLKCGRLEHRFLRVRCTTCHAERLVAFSCQRRVFCTSCGARRMTESAAVLVDEVLQSLAHGLPGIVRRGHLCLTAEETGRYSSNLR